MNQLLVVSTQKEIQPLLKRLDVHPKPSSFGIIEIREDLEILISGVGSPSTIFNLTKRLLTRHFDRVVQVGVAGSYKNDIPVGSIVEVGQDCFADLGIDDNGTFVQLFNAGLTPSNDDPFNKGLLVNPLQNTLGFPMVNAITINTTSGSEELIKQRKSDFNPDIESMEGAAAFYVCLMMGIPIIQVRSISNMVEPRNRKAWKMDDAITNLNNWLFNFVKSGRSE